MPTTTHPIPLHPELLDALLNEAADLLGGVDATNGETFRDTLNLLTNVAGGLNGLRLEGELVDSRLMNEAEKAELLRRLLALAWGDLETAEAIVGDLLTIEFPDAGR